MSQIEDVIWSVRRHLEETLNTIAHTPRQLDPWFELDYEYGTSGLNGATGVQGVNGYTTGHNINYYDLSYVTMPADDTIKINNVSKNKMKRGYNARNQI